MWRLVVIVVVLGTAIGAMMPSDLPKAAPGAPKPVTIVAPAASSASELETPAPSYGEVVLQRQADGHFYTDVQVNGTPIHFLVDTGASAIALTVDDAQRVGLSFNEADFEPVGMGAGGTVYGLPVQLDQVALGNRTVTGVQAAILDGGTQSLLGQAFLARFDSVEIRGDTMVLR